MFPTYRCCEIKWWFCVNVAALVKMKWIIIKLFIKRLRIFNYYSSFLFKLFEILLKSLLHIKYQEELYSKSWFFDQTQLFVQLSDIGHLHDRIIQFFIWYLSAFYSGRKNHIIQYCVKYLNIGILYQVFRILQWVLFNFWV